jgi:hypothetical protein
VAQTQFIEGPAGTGKTTYAIQHIRDLLEDGIRPESILVLVPQRTLGHPYHAAFTAPGWPGGAQIDVATLGGLARRGLETFWPQVAAKAGFSHLDEEPTFLTIETAQYYISALVEPAIQSGLFDSVNLPRFRIMSQLLDNLSKAAVNGFPMDEVASRLTAAWGERHSSRPPVYRAGQEIMQEFRAQCLTHNVLDFSLQIEVFCNHLLHESIYQTYFESQYQHLVVDNLEESFPVTGDFIRHVWPMLETALLLYDTDAGYRVFLGADPHGMRDLSELCDTVEHWDQPVRSSPDMIVLADEMTGLLCPPDDVAPPLANDPRTAYTYSFNRFYPEMIAWVADTIAELVADGVPLREIVVLAPYMSDALHFSLTTQLGARGVATFSHRPSRALRDESAAWAFLTLMALAHPDWDYRPPQIDFANALEQAIEDLDPIRAWLLAQIVYRPTREGLGVFDEVEARAQARITYRAGQRYEELRQWIEEYAASEAGSIPPDHFISRLFGEVLSQPGFGFHSNLDAGRAIAELVESARRFRRTRYPDGVDNWIGAGYEYFTLVREGLLSALYVPSWSDEAAEAVFIGPAHTFVMRNRWVDYQFWLDAGSSHWWERLEQPLTHPYVLSRNYPRDKVWTDEMEFSTRRETLRRLVVGLTRRCRQHVYVAISNLSDQGYEQRGPLLSAFQQIAQRYTITESDVP